MAKQNREIVISDEKDNWRDDTYDHRYLDGLASIFNICNPCAAVAYLPSKNKFLLSYNRECDDTSKSKVRAIETLINNFLSGDESSKDTLLALYLIFNPEFILTLRFCINNKWCKNTENQILIEKFYKQMETSKDFLDTYCYDSVKLQEVFKSRSVLPEANTVDEIERIKQHYINVCDEIKATIERKNQVLSSIYREYQNLLEAIKNDSVMAKLISKPISIEANETIRAYA